MRLLKNSNSAAAAPQSNNVPGVLRIAMRPTETVGGAVAAAPPKFTILKRPSASPSSSSASASANGPSPFDDDKDWATSAASNNNNSPAAESARDREAAVKRPPVKSLEQRKQEYAEARLRILGDAKFSDDDDDEEQQPQQQQGEKGREPQKTPNNNSGNNGRNVGRNNNSSNNNNINKSGQPALQYPTRPPPVFNASIPPPRFDPCIRVPRGPDGSVGFQSRR